MEDQVAGCGELRLACATVICFAIPRVVESNFWADLNSGAYPVTKHQCVFGVFGVYTGSLALLIVE